MIPPLPFCHAVIQDHGPDDGGWGIASVSIEGPPRFYGPIVYCGQKPQAIENMIRIAEKLAQKTGKPTMVVRFGAPEQLAYFE